MKRMIEFYDIIPIIRIKIFVTFMIENVPKRETMVITVTPYST